MKILVLNPADKGIKNSVRDLLYGCWCGGRRIGGTQMPPLNLLYISTVLKEAGHEVFFIDAGVDYDSYESVLKNVAEINIVIILSSTNSFDLDKKVLQNIKKQNPSIKTIIFGSHPTFMPQYCLAESCIDIIVLREPEFIIRDVVEKIKNNAPWEQIKGIGFRKNNSEIVLNDYYPYIDNLDALPIPDRKLLPKKVDYFNPVVKRMPYTTMLTSRGCPAKCNFCTVPSFYGNKIRYKSAGNVLKEMEYLASIGYKEIFFRDETFTVFKERNKEIYQSLIDNKTDLTWICNSRVDTLEENDIVMMKKAGCHLIKFGVESGDQRILDNINKGITVEQTEKAFKLCNQNRMDTHAHVMLGCPGETVETILRTIKFVKDLRPFSVSFGIHTPYPGTKLFADIARSHPEISDGRKASMEKLHVTGFFNEYFTDLNKDELEKLVTKAYREFYFRPGYILQKLISIKSLDELMRLVIAGSNIFSFGMTGKQS